MMLTHFHKRWQMLHEMQVDGDVGDAALFDAAQRAGVLRAAKLDMDLWFIAAKKMN